MKYILMLLLALSITNAKSQNYKFHDTENYHNKLRLNIKTGEVIQVQDDGYKVTLQEPIEANSTQERFKLIKTENMWNFILLDEFDGRLWQVQFTVDEDAFAGSIPINTSRFSNTQSKKFKVEPLISMFQFYLINDENGDMWKFQWSTKGDEYRWIEKLE